jgi:hypothetical protein
MLKLSILMMHEVAYNYSSCTVRRTENIYKAAAVEALRKKKNKK